MISHLQWRFPRLPRAWAILPLLGLAFVPLSGTELTGNLIADGGVEQWTAIGPDGAAGSWWNTLRGLEMTHDEKGRVLKPMILSQPYSTQAIKQETQDVHGGKNALRLKGGVYLHPSGPEAYKTQEGDVYIVRYWAKGEGKTEVALCVYGDARGTVLQNILPIETKGSPTRAEWSLIEKRFQVTARAPFSVYPHLSASEEMLIDDIFMARVLREEERRLVPIASDCQERVAFATETDGKITIDGKLDEPAWGQAIPFSGFRSMGDQNFLAAIQPSFRVIFNASVLYFGIEIPLANARQVLDDLKSQPLLAKGQPRSKTDTYSGRESVELFLQAAGKGSYRQLVVSLDGYRYDGSGMDGAWNGKWEYAVAVAEDRWFLEMKVPVQDLGVEWVAPAEGWRLNLCVHPSNGAVTWTAVGVNFHNPAAFGKLIAQDFAKWRDQQPVVRARKKSEILQAAGSCSILYSNRLASIDASAVAPAGGDGKIQDWEAVTRAYSRMDYIGDAYRCVEEEVRYGNFFK